MLRKLTLSKVSEDEEIKASGLTLDFDEIAKRGSLSKEEGNIGKWYGIYVNRQPGTFMSRLTVPGGVVTSGQARLIADTAQHYAQGRISITTRQALQYHWLSCKNLPLMMRDLSEKGISCFHGCGDVNRNTTACPMADVCSYARFNVYPYAREIASQLAADRELDNLPRKFKITLSGCSAGCAQPYINCLGLVAVKRRIKGKDVNGFKAVIGGGMGWKPFKGQELFSFVPASSVFRLSKAVAVLFRENGDRFNRAKSRLKFVVHRKGVDFCRDFIIEYLKKHKVDVEAFSTRRVKDTGVSVPYRPLRDSLCGTSDGLSVVRVQVPKGDMTFLQLRRVAELSEIYGNQRLITTNRQNLELHGVPNDKHAEARQEVHKIGFATEGFYGLKDIVTCVGTTFCPKAVSTTHNLYDALIPIVNKARYACVTNSVIINITGCPNSCSPYRISDIGFRGMRIREEQGSVEGYEVLVGGEHDCFGQKLGEFKFDDCAGVLEGILNIFLKIKKDDETLARCVARKGISPFKKGVYNVC